MNIIILGLVVIAVIIFIIWQWRSLPHICPSCGGRFDEAKADCFCIVGNNKKVYFCKKCVSQPIRRLGTDNIILAGKGFSAEEIFDIQDAIYFYKQV